MKRTLCALCIAIMLLPLTAAASQVDLGRLSLFMPASCDVFTANMRPDDPLLTLYGTSAADVAQDLGSRGLLMEAREIAGAYIISLSLAPHNGPDFWGMTDSALMEEAQRLAQRAAPASVLHAGQASFLMYQSGNTLSCVTRVNGALYRLSLQAEGGLREPMTGTLKKIAQSMDFGQGQ